MCWWFEIRLARSQLTSRWNILFTVRRPEDKCCLQSERVHRLHIEVAHCVNSEDTYHLQTDELPLTERRCIQFTARIRTLLTVRRRTEVTTRSRTLLTVRRFILVTTRWCNAYNQKIYTAYRQNTFAGYSPKTHTASLTSNLFVFTLSRLVSCVDDLRYD